MVASRRRLLYPLVFVLLYAVSVGFTQSPPVSPSPPVEGPVRAETLAARKAALQARLEQVGQGAVPSDDIESLRALLEQQLKALAGIEAAWQRRAWYVTELERLPRYVQELTAERQALLARPPRRFPAVSEQLRDEQVDKLQAAQAEIDALHKEQTAGELRLASIPAELEQRAADRVQQEKDLLSARSDAASEGEQRPSLLARVDLLDLRLQWQQAEMETLEAEREWLTKQGPLHDAQQRLAQARLTGLQQELEALQEQLGQALVRESDRLTATADELAQRLHKTSDPVERIVLAAGLETIRVRQSTADYRQRLNHLSQQTLTKERQIGREKQEMEHLMALIEKRASGERVARRLQVAFARLKREQLRARAVFSLDLETQLDTLSGEHLDLNDRLYEFDPRAEERLERLSLALQTLSPAQRDASLTRARQALDDQKAAMREQRQALAGLEQELTRLIAMHREHIHLLDDSAQFVRTRMFWLREDPTVGWPVLQDAWTGAVIMIGRLNAYMHAELARLPRGWTAGGRFWVLMAVLWLGLPCGALWLRKRLQRWTLAGLACDPNRETLGSRLATTGAMVVQTAIWPLCLVLVAWAWPLLLVEQWTLPDLEVALASGLQVTALVLWIGLLVWTCCRRGGWSEHYLGWNREVCQQLRWAVGLGCVAAVLFLVPRHVLRLAPGEPEMAPFGLALARLCFTAFEVVMLGLVGIVWRRGSRLMTAILATSRQGHGILWRLWPLCHVVLLAGLVSLTTLDLLGYRYAARFLWSRSGVALVVILGLIALDQVVGAVVKRLTWQRPRPEDTAGDPSQPSEWSLLQQGRHFVRGVLILSGLLAVQHIYGVDQNLLRLLDAVHLLEAGKTAEGETLWLTLGDVITAFLIIAGAMVVMRYLPGIYEVAVFPRVQWDSGLRYTFLTLSRYTLFFLTVWWSLAVIHVRWSSIQWIVAAVSVGVGFGLQEIVGNFVSGLILLLERPIRVDDIVSVGTEQGTVKRITIRATAIQNGDNQTVIIPNKELIVGRVTNWTLGDTHIRLAIPLGVAYGSDLELVHRLLTEIITSQPQVLENPAPSILLRSFGDSALQWEISCVVPRPQDRGQTAHELLLRIDQAFRQHGIEMPFPQRDFHLRSVAAAIEFKPLSNGQAPSPAPEELRRAEAPEADGRQPPGV